MYRYPLLRVVPLNWASREDDEMRAAAESRRRWSMIEHRNDCDSTIPSDLP